jgi:hypothetical protein
MSCQVLTGTPRKLVDLIVQELSGRQVIVLTTTRMVHRTAGGFLK